MAKRQNQFTQEQIEILLKNPNVESISSNTIRFTSEFKELAMFFNNLTKRDYTVFPKTYN